jgi:hypothetical protein
LLALVAALVGIVSWTAAPRHTVATSVGYNQSGAFSYTADAPASVYGDTGVTTGDPVYLRLASQVVVHFAYQFTTSVPHAVQGSYTTTVVLALDNGWKRTFSVGSEATVPFTGDSFTATLPLDLPQVQAMLDAIAQQTGVQRYTATLTVAPTVTLAGTVAGTAVSEQFTPALTFTFDPLELVLQQGAAKTDPVSPSKPGSVRQTRTAPAQLALPGLHPSIALLRALAGVALLLALLAGGLALAATRAAAQWDEVRRIRARYGALLVPVGNDTAPASGRIVEVASFAALVKVATQCHSLILDSQGVPVHRFTVLDGTAVYQYTVGGPAALPPHLAAV